jgi:hypothetical protein
MISPAEIRWMIQLQKLNDSELQLREYIPSQWSPYANQLPHFPEHLYKISNCRSGNYFINATIDQRELAFH